VGNEIKIMSLLGEKFMSDEETDPEDGSVLNKRTPSWRSPKLTKMVAKLDKRYSKNKDDMRPLKPRRNGDHSIRSIPKNAPSLAISSTSSADEVDVGMEPLPVSEPEHSDTSNRTEEHVTSLSDESADSSDEELDDWVQNATGVGQ